MYKPVSLNQKQGLKNTSKTNQIPITDTSKTVEKILKQNNIAQIDTSLDYKDDIKEQVRKIQERNQNLLAELQSYGVDERQIEEFDDNRNFLQKILGLKENQGIISMGLDLLNRPAEAAQGITAAFLNDDETILEAAWKGFSGQKQYSINDLGLDIQDPLVNAAAGISFELLVDPLNFLDKPLRALFSKSKTITKGIVASLKDKLSKTETSNAILVQLEKVFDRAETFFKKTFGTWSDTKVQQHFNDVSSLKNSAVRLQQEGQTLVKSMYEDAMLLNDTIIKAIKENKIDTPIRTWLKEDVGLKDDIFVKLNSNIEADVIVGKEALIKQLNTYYGRLIEENFQHGYTFKHFFNQMLDNGVVEVVAKSADEVKQGNIYKTLEQFIKYALLEPGANKYVIEDLVEIKKEVSSLNHLGKVVLDASGAPITNRLSSVQGYRLSLTETGKEVLSPYWRALKKTKLVESQITKNLTVEQEVLTKLIQDGEVIIPSMGKDNLNVIERLKNLYEKTTNKPFQTVIEPYLNGYKVVLLPNPQAFKVYNEIKKVKDVLDFQTNKVNKFFKDINRVQDVIADDTSIYKNYVDKLFSFIQTNQRSLKIDATTLWTKDKVFNEYLKANKIKELDINKLPKFVTPTKLTKNKYASVVEDFERSVFSLNKTKIKGVVYDVDSVNLIGYDKWINFKFDFQALTVNERINVIAYLLDRQLITYDDLINLGFRSFDDFDDAVKLNRLENMNWAISASMESENGFLNVANWINETNRKYGLPHLIKQKFTNIYYGDFLNQQTLAELVAVFSQNKAVDLLANKVLKDKTTRFDTIKPIITNLKKKETKLLDDYRKLFSLTNSKEYARNLAYDKFLNKGYTFTEPDLKLLALQLEKKSIGLDDFDIDKVLNDLKTKTSIRADGLEDKIRNLKRKIKVKKDYFKSHKFNSYALQFNKKNGTELINLITSKSFDIPTLDDKFNVYLYMNELGQIKISNNYKNASAFVKLDYSDYTQIKELQKAKIDLDESIERLNLTQEVLFETLIIQHWKKFPEFRFNQEELNELLLELRVKWNNELIEELVAASPNVNLLDTKFAGNVYQIQKRKLKELDDEFVEILRMKTDIINRSDTIPTDTEAFDKVHKALTERQKNVLKLKQRVQQRIDNIEAKSKLVYKNEPIGNFTDEVIKNITNKNWVPTDSLSGRNMVEKIFYKEQIDKDISFVRALISNQKQDSLKTLSSLGGYDNAVKRIPEVFQSTVERLVNVQFTIHNSIARNFKHHFGIDMTNWGVNGYLRHMLSPEMANIAMITNTIKGKLNGPVGEYFGNSAKYIGMFREYQASAADVNLMKADELFNTNPIEATAIALELLPRHFHLGAVFKSMVENGLLRPVDVSDYEITFEGVKALKKRLLKDVDKLKNKETLSTFQAKQLKQYEESLKHVDNYLNVYEKQKMFYDVNLKNTYTQEELAIIAKKEERLKYINDVKQKAEAEGLDVSGLNDEIEIIEQQIKNLKADKQSYQTLPKELQQEFDNIEKEYSLAAYQIRVLQSAGFNGTNSWLKNNPQFGKEYIWITKDMFRQIKDAFGIVSKASGEYDALYSSDWGKQIQDVIDRFETNQATYAIHKGVYDSVVRLAQRSQSKDSKVLWNTLERMIIKPFKQISVATVGFHIRNLFTNLSNAYLAGINPVEMSQEMFVVQKELKVFNKTLEDISKLLATGRFRDAESQIKMIQQLINEGISVDDIVIPFDLERQRIFDDFFKMLEIGVIGNNHFSNDLALFLGSIRDSAYGRELKRFDPFEITKQTKAASDTIKKFSNKLFEISKNADDIAKVAMYRLLHQPKYQNLMFGAYDTPEKYVKFVLFDYNNLTHTEETVMKALFPFYTWARKNLEFQIKNIGRNSKRYRNLYKILTGWRQGLTLGLDESDYNDQYFPIWNDDGKITYVKIQLEGYLAADDILMGNGIINSLTPVLKAPIEMITGYDFFTNRNFDSHGQFYGFGLGFSSLLFTTNLIWKMIYENYVPTYDEKKIAGVLGKKLIQVTEIAKYLLGNNQQDDKLFGIAHNLFPSVFSQDNLYQVLYFKERERNELLYKVLNSPLVNK